MPQSTSPASRLQKRLLAVNLAAAGLVVAAIACVPTGNRVVVVAPPWSAPDRVVSIIAEAGGTLVNGGNASWLAVADSPSPGFASRLFAAGAVLILDGRLASACLGGTRT